MCSECSPGDPGVENSPREDVSDPAVIPPIPSLHPLLPGEFSVVWDTGVEQFTGWTSLCFKLLSFSTFTSAWSDKFLNSYRAAVLPLSGEPQKY